MAFISWTGCKDGFLPLKGHVAMFLFYLFNYLFIYFVAVVYFWLFICSLHPPAWFSPAYSQTDCRMASQPPNLPHKPRSDVWPCRISRTALRVIVVLHVYSPLCSTRPKGSCPTVGYGKGRVWGKKKTGVPNKKNGIGITGSGLDHWSEF